jgi:dihydrofolate reductase
LSSDLKTFRRLTMGKPIVMGRRTFESIGKPLDGRDNIVITRDASFAPDGVSVTDNIDDAMTLARVLARTSGADEVMVIGGAKIYDATLPLADRIYLTRVHARPDGDRTFEGFDPAEWSETSREALPQGPKDEHAATLLVYDRLKSAS